MALIPTQGNEILIDAPGTKKSEAARPSPEQELISWITTKTKDWASHRDNSYGKHWQQYWRLWRGIWAPDEKNRKSERSRLIAPALAQAVESTAAETEEALFSKEVWIDVTDDVAEAGQVDMLMIRDQFLEDLEEVGAKEVFREANFLGVLLGTSIIKVSVEVRKVTHMFRDPVSQELSPTEQERVFVGFTAIRPDEFIPDPNAVTIDEMLGCAHEVVRPLHTVLEKIKQGVYYDEALESLTPQSRSAIGIKNIIDVHTDPGSRYEAPTADSVTILEWHGKVPLRLLNRINPVKNLVDAILDEESDKLGDDELIEAIVTIANGTVLLRAMPNPFTMSDRSIVASPYEKVPGRFWGRGASEKGVNAQKALDAELRSRMDALGFVSAPMLGVDSSKIPKGFRLEVKPGKIWLTQGRPSEALEPVKIGDINPSTFNQASEMERMVQMGTGTFDSASALNQQSQSGASSLSSNSLLMGAFVKRSRRAVANFENRLLKPALRKALWRYMQFDPVRYPVDFKFKINAAMGIVAREVEAMQLTQLMGMLPADFPGVSAAVAKGIIELSSVANKAEIASAIDQALQPPPEEEQKRQQELADIQFEAAKAEATQALLENQKTIAETRKILSEANVAARKADVEDTKVDQEQQRIMLQAQEIEQFAQQNDIAEQRLELQERQVHARLAQLNRSGGS